MDGSHGWIHPEINDPTIRYEGYEVWVTLW